MSPLEKWLYLNSRLSVGSSDRDALHETGHHEHHLHRQVIKLHVNFYSTRWVKKKQSSHSSFSVSRLINWFSHHLSNFQFRWSWDDWWVTESFCRSHSLCFNLSNKTTWWSRVRLWRSDCLAVDIDKPKPKFVKEVLEKCMRYLSVFQTRVYSSCFIVASLWTKVSVCSFLCRLSYHQRIVDIVPPTFSALIPAEPIFLYKYEDESSCKYASKSIFIFIYWATGLINPLSVTSS